MKKARFNLSHEKVLSMRMGELVPIASYPVIPGDVFQQFSKALIRVSPLLAPVFGKAHVRIESYFVPNRLIWKDGGGANTDWEAFITGGPAGTSAPTHPTITVNTGTGWAEGSLADYLRMGTGVDDVPCNALPFRAYAKIVNDWYLDNELDTLLTIDTTDGADTTTNTTLQMRRWEKDRFTSARTSAQRGTAVTLNLGTSAPVKRTASAAQWKGYVSGTDTVLDGDNTDIRAADATGLMYSATAAHGGNPGVSWDPMSGLYTDLSTASSATINQLRESFATQKFMENRAHWGGRYVDYLAFLGIKSSDARLQNAEYLGGGHELIQFSEVLQTGGTDAGAATGVGNMRGHGISAMRSNAFRKFFEEHGWVITLLSVTPKTLYSNTIPKDLTMTTKYDYFQQEYAHVGAVPILNQEVYIGDTGPTDTFGYNDRYDELRRFESSVHGEMKSTLNYWHMGRIFSADVTLNASFITSNPTNRINADQTNDTLWVTVENVISALRPIPKLGTPGGV